MEMKSMDLIRLKELADMAEAFNRSSFRKTEYLRKYAKYKELFVFSDLFKKTETEYIVVGVDYNPVTAIIEYKVINTIDASDVCDVSEEYIDKAVVDCQ